MFTIGQKDSGDFSILDEKNNEIILDSDKIINDEVFNYQIIEREQMINNLINWISESTRINDKQLMKLDLKYLISLNDKYIFSSLTTNEYIAKSDNEHEFNLICKDFIFYGKKDLTN